MNVFSYADLSTVHITKKDSVLLAQNANTNLIPSIIVYEYEYGFFIPILDNMEYRRLEKAGFSKAFTKLLKVCKRKNINLLRLDCDGSEDDKLERFEW